MYREKVDGGEFWKAKILVKFQTETQVQAENAHKITEREIKSRQEAQEILNNQPQLTNEFPKDEGTPVDEESFTQTDMVVAP